MRKIIINIICFLFINFLASMGSFSIILLGYEMFSALDNGLTDFEITCIDISLIFLIFGRLFVLPIAYKVLENSQQYIYISKFFKLAKKSIRMKLGILLCTYLCHWTPGFTWFENGFDGQFLVSLYAGLLGSYLVLFGYWFVEDKIKKLRMIKHKQ